MKRIATLVGRDLKWTQPSARRLSFELRAGGELAATLRFPSPLRTIAVGESADGVWTFRRAGIFTNSAVVHGDADKPAARFRAHPFRDGGNVNFPDGRSLRVACNVWRSRYWFTDASPRALMELENRGCFHHSSTVTLRPSAADLPEIPFVVMLGWYLSFMNRNDVAAIVRMSASH